MLVAGLDDDERAPAGLAVGVRGLKRAILRERLALSTRIRPRCA